MSKFVYCNSYFPDFAAHEKYCFPVKINCIFLLYKESCDSYDVRKYGRKMYRTLNIHRNTFIATFGSQTSNILNWGRNE